MTERALDVEFSVEKMYPLPHAGMAEPWSGAMLCGIKAGAVIPNGELQSAVHASEGDVHRTGVGMAGDIPQSLLRDAKEAKGHVARKRLGNPLRVQVYANRL